MGIANFAANLTGFMSPEIVGVFTTYGVSGRYRLLKM